MNLLGNRNWYLPSWLEWLPHFGVEGPSTHVYDLRETAPAPAGHTATVNGNPPDVPVAAGGPKGEA